MADLSKTYPPSVMSRIKKDLVNLQKEPITGAAALPNNGDLSFWDAIIRVNVKHPKKKYVDMHFNILFPVDYPASPPDIGFTFDFNYSMGASYRLREGRLAHKLSLCLDILGNFKHIHTEWKASIGSGWSPAYSVSSLIINLQTILLDLGDSLSKQATEKLVNEATKFYASDKDLMALSKSVPNEETIALARVTKKLSKDALEFAKSIGINKAPTKLEKLAEFEAKIRGSQEQAVVENMDTNAESTAVAAPVVKEVKIDENIICYQTGQNYTEDILGYGLSVVKTGRHVNVSTPAELLSKSAFEGGLRSSTNKTPFQYFMPAFINRKHASDSMAWRRQVKDTVVEISRKEYPNVDLAEGIYAIFTRLINTLVLEMMKQPEMNSVDWDYDNESYEDYEKKRQANETEKGRLSKAPSIAYFEAICSFWRTFVWLREANLPINPKFKKMGTSKVKNFTYNEKYRLKATTPDVGCMMSAFMSFLPGSDVKPQDFVDAYLDEFFLRCVMWWQKSNTPARPDEVFRATKTGRDLTMFQILFAKHVIGGNESATVALMDGSNGKAAERLEAFQKIWKQAGFATGDYDGFLKAVGCSETMKQKVMSPSFVSDCVNRCRERGSAYTWTPRGNQGYGNGGGRRRY